MIRIGFWSMSNVIHYSCKYIEQKYPGFILLRGWMHLVSLGFVEFYQAFRAYWLDGAGRFARMEATEALIWDAKP